MDGEEKDLAGITIGEYEILKPLGKGGMGVVYLAQHRMLERQVAIKILPEQFASDEGLVQRFLREARAAAKLNHPNIVQIYDFMQTDEMYCYVMEYVPGKSLNYYMRNFGVFEEKNVISFLKVACNALGFAHNAGIVHRDIKPDNFLLTPTGVVKLCDLGLARITQEESSLTMTGSTMGTPFYISPEQIRGTKHIDGRTDIYSLGATAYHLLTGQVPFKGSSAADIMAKHLNDPLLSPKHLNAKLTDGMCHIIAKLMTKDPDHRYQKCADVLDDLRQLEAGMMPGVEPVPVHQTTIAMPAAEALQAATAKALPDGYTPTKIYPQRSAASAEPAEVSKPEPPPLQEEYVQPDYSSPEPIPPPTTMMVSPPWYRQPLNLILIVVVVILFLMLMAALKKKSAPYPSPLPPSALDEKKNDPPPELATKSPSSSSATTPSSTEKISIAAAELEMMGHHPFWITTDTTISEHDPNKNLSGGETLRVGSGHAALLYLDLKGQSDKFLAKLNEKMPWRIKLDLPLPPLKNAHLILASTESELAKGKPLQLSLYRLLRPWNSTEATWTEVAHGQKSWSTPGAGSAGVDRAEKPTATVMVDLAQRTYSFDVLSDLQLWRDKKAENLGWILVADQAPKGSVTFTSSQFHAELDRPHLDVTFDPVSLRKHRP